MGVGGLLLEPEVNVAREPSIAVIGHGIAADQQVARAGAPSDR
jgi:hypothetical protein